MDGRKIAIQVLPHEEKIGANDAVLSVRVLVSEQKPLLAAVDLPLPKKSSLSYLAKKLIEIFLVLANSLPVVPEDDTLISIAKGFSTGPPVTVKSVLKLKWYNINSNDEGKNNSGQ